MSAQNAVLAPFRHRTPPPSYQPGWVLQEFTNVEQRIAGSSANGLGRYEIATSEVGVVDQSWPVGHAFRYGAKGDGIADDTLALQNMNASMAGAICCVDAATYRVASNLTLTSAVDISAGAVIKPDAGAVVTIAGPLRAGLWRIFDLSAGGRVDVARGVLFQILPEWWGASNAASAATNTAAIQAAILASLGMTSLADQPAFLHAPILLSALYLITTIFIPRFASIRGASGNRRYGFSSTSDQPIVVLGRTSPELDWLDLDLRFDIEGSVTTITDPAKPNQVGMRADFTGGAGTGYIAPLHLQDVEISNCGGHGVEIVGDANAMIVYADWRNIEIFNCQGNAVHTKLGILNASRFDNVRLLNNGNGALFEGLGGGEASEAITFVDARFEANGKPVGATDCAVGSYGFKSSMSTGHYRFINPYFEGNGNRVGDTTGCNVDVQAAWMLSIEGGVLASANNLVALRKGGQAKIEGAFIAPGLNNTSIIWLDQAPAGTDYSNIHLGPNKFDAVYTDAQLIRVTNSATTTVTGFRETRNYVSTPHRERRGVLRDGATITADDGAIGYTAVKRLTNNADGATTIPVSGIATIVADTFNGRVSLSSDLGAIVADFLMAAGGALTLVAQVGTNVTTASGTAAHLNVYHDGVLNAWVAENKLASGIKAAVRLEGVDVMAHADDGYYEAQFA